MTNINFLPTTSKHPQAKRFNMRIKKDHQREMLWSFIKFSQLILQGNVSRLVWRISVPDPDLEIRGEGGGGGHPDP